MSRTMKEAKDYASQLTLAEICDELKTYESMLVRYIKVRGRNLNQASAYTRSICGFVLTTKRKEDENGVVREEKLDNSTEGQEKTNKKAKSDASKIFECLKKLHKSTALDAHNPDHIEEILSHAPKGLEDEYNKSLLVVYDACEAAMAYDSTEKATRIMVQALSEALPVWDKLKPIHGLGSPSFGRLVGEVGNLDGYPTVQCMWRRLGLGVDAKGRAQGYKKRDKTKAEHIIEGYSPDRRSVAWMVYDTMFKSQPAMYRNRYEWRKKLELSNPVVAASKGANGWAEARARRYVFKRLLIDIWEVWTGKRCPLYESEDHIYDIFAAGDTLDNHPEYTERAIVIHDEPVKKKSKKPKDDA